MNATDEGLRWNGGFRIVRADLDLAHVFAPQDRIEFEGHGDRFTISHKNPKGKPGYSHNVVLTAVAGEQPSFDVISRDYPLPEFSSHHKHRYRHLAQRIEMYAQKNPNLRRLEGTIEFPCHDFTYQDQESEADPHEPRTVTAQIHVYQFANVVERGKVLWVIYKPLSNTCVTNGNGTAIGYD